MSSIFLDKRMPFFQFGDLITLREISTDDWVPFIVSHFNDGGKPSQW